MIVIFISTLVVVFAGRFAASIYRLSVPVYHLLARRLLPNSHFQTTSMLDLHISYDGVGFLEFILLGREIERTRVRNRNCVLLE